MVEEQTTVSLCPRNDCKLLEECWLHLLDRSHWGKFLSARVMAGNNHNEVLFHEQSVRSALIPVLQRDAFVTVGSAGLRSQPQCLGEDHAAASLGNKPAS